MIIDQSILRPPRISTGLRLFFILVIALLPLAILAVFATNQITQNAQYERETLIRQSVEDTAVRLDLRLNNDLDVLKQAANRMALGNDPAPICAQLRRDFQMRDDGIAALIYHDGGPDSACVIGNFSESLRTATRENPSATTQILTKDRGLMLMVPGNIWAAKAWIFYPTSSLLQTADTVGDMPAAQLELRYQGAALPLFDIPDQWNRRLNAAIAAEREVHGLRLELKFERASQGSPAFFAQIIPFLTVIAAAGIGWVVVNRMLIRPVSRLQRKMGRYRTGERLPPMDQSPFNATEIENLDKAFLALTRKVAVDKQALDEGLDQQIKLTREVHHRVKNNLQIVASLISLHARTAKTRDATLAYSKIQRRVDALAMVQRNHFAGSEEIEGINLRSLINEIAGSFQMLGDSSVSDQPLPITVKIDNIRVTQDIAVPVAFLLTEILELIALTNPAGPIDIVSDRDTDQPGRINISVIAPALAVNAALDSALSTGIERVLTGLVRQLRGKLERDRDLGMLRFSIAEFIAPANNPDQDSPRA